MKSCTHLDVEVVFVEDVFKFFHGVVRQLFPSFDVFVGIYQAS